MQNELRIIFMGTPEFAVSSLEILVRNGYNVVAVITAPDKPAGRGQILHESAVKQFASLHGIPVLQPLKLKDPDFLDILKSFNANLQIVVAFRMLPELVWAMPALGTFNLHASLLPDYRGAAPINRAVMNGEKMTGLSTFFLQQEIDTGDVIMQEKLAIGDDETAGELHDRMMILGAELVLKTVRAIEAGAVTTFPQPVVAHPKTAPKIFKEDCKIPHEKSLDEVYNFIRGLSPYPGAWMQLDGKIFKVFKCEKENAGHNHAPGVIVSDGKNYLKLALPGGFLHLKEVQMEGKKRMLIEEFLRGYNHKSGLEE